MFVVLGLLKAKLFKIGWPPIGGGLAAPEI